jgi:hypothetical protein
MPSPPAGGDEGGAKQGGSCPLGAAGGQPSGGLGSCPAATAAAAAAAAATTPNAPPAAVCPFGFGAGGAGKGGTASTPLHCPLCRSLLFDCHAAQPCGHKACRECLSRFRDCPLCGADVQRLEPDADAQGLVDAFLGAHGVYPDAVAAALDVGPLMDDLMALAGRGKSTGGGGGGAAGAPPAAITTAPAPTSAAGKLSLTAALLNGVALRSYAGGNVSAALARFEATRDALTGVLEELGKEVEEEQAKGAAAAAAARSTTRRRDAQAARVALATALGCIGDCKRRAGDEAAAEGSYRDAAARLSALAGVSSNGGNGGEGKDNDDDDDGDDDDDDDPQTTAEARRGLGVTLSKLGDLAYARGDVGSAFREYSRVLDLRRRSAAAGAGGAVAGGEADADALLDLASALIKAGDAATHLPASAEQPPQSPAAYFAEARALLESPPLAGAGADDGDGGASTPLTPLDKARAAKQGRFLEALAAVEAAVASKKTTMQ